MSFLRKLFSGGLTKPTGKKPRAPSETEREARLLFLAKFRKSQSVKELTRAHMAMQQWREALGADPDETVEELEQVGLLTRPTLRERLEGSMSLQQLKELCRDRDLKLSGKKADLAERLIAFGISETAVPLGDNYICSAAGRESADAYNRQKANERQEAQLQSADLLDAHDFAGAVRLVCAYENRQVFQRGMGVDWFSGTVGLGSVKSIYSAQKAFLHNVSKDDLATVRLIAALDDLWGEQVKIISDRDAPVQGCRFNLGIAARQLQFHHSNTYGVDAASLRPIAIVEMEYLFTNGDCAACQARSGKRYRLRQIPDLPSEDCTCELGCRCSFGAVLTDLDE